MAEYTREQRITFANAQNELIGLAVFPMNCKCSMCSKDLAQHYGDMLLQRRVTSCPKCHQSFVE